MFLPRLKKHLRNNWGTWGGFLSGSILILPLFYMSPEDAIAYVMWTSIPLMIAILLIMIFLMHDLTKRVRRGEYSHDQFCELSNTCKCAQRREIGPFDPDTFKPMDLTDEERDAWIEAVDD